MKNKFISHFFKFIHNFILHRRFDPQQFKPKELYIELTGVCNLKCPHCPRTYSNKKRGHMEDKLFFDIIRNLEKEYSNIPLIGFHLFGEITTRTNFGRLIQFARKTLPKTYLGISTNLNIKTDDDIVQLLNSGLDSIGIWPAAASEDIYQGIRKGGSYKRVKNNIRKLLEEREKRKLSEIDVHIGFIHFRSNYSKIHEFLKEFKFIKNYSNTRFLQIYSNDWAGQVPFNNIFLSVNNSSFLKIPIICTMPFTTLVIASDGTASLCCMDMNLLLKIGKFNEKNSILDLWSSENAKIIREKMIKLKPPQLCQNCHRFKLNPIKWILYERRSKPFTII